MTKQDAIRKALETGDYARALALQSEVAEENRASIQEELDAIGQVNERNRRLKAPGSRFTREQQRGFHSGRSVR